MAASDIRDNAAWKFETARFFVGFYAEPEETDPSDSFEFPEDIEAVHSGAVEWFCASVRVYLKPEADSDPSEWSEISADYLGSCAYKSVREFYTSHRDPDPMNRNCSIMRAARGDNVVICHYFPSMVSEAVRNARLEMTRLQSVHLRNVA